MKKIIICNAGFGPNKGDHAILACMMKSIKDMIPEADISAFPILPNKKDFFEFLNTLNTSQLLILGGGQILRDDTSSLVIGVSSARILLAKIMGKRIMLYGIGAGPIKTKLARLMTKLFISKVNLITVRNKESKELLVKRGVNPSIIHVTADPAISLLPATDERIEEILERERLTNAQPLIAISPRLWFCYTHSIIPIKYATMLHIPLKGQEKFKIFKKSLARLADYLVDTLGAKIVFVPTTPSGKVPIPGMDDDIVSEEIIELMSNKDSATVIGDYMASEIKGLMGRMELLIGTRMHSIIFASAMYVPVVGIALSPKFKGFFRLLDQENRVIDIDNQPDCYNKLLNVVIDTWKNREQIRQGLKERIPEIQKKESLNVKLMCDLLFEESP